MAYFPELSTFQYKIKGQPVDIAMVGWLDLEHSHTKGPVSEQFLERLWLYCRNPVRQSKGFHSCDFCGPEWVMQVAERNEERLDLGSAEILVRSNSGVTYAAPDLIYHYIIEHQYRPPQEFIEAVETAPLPFDPAQRMAL